MPFEQDDGVPLDELVLAQRPADGELFALRQPFGYLDPVSGVRYRVPASGWRTDLASVPHPLWSLVASYGRQSAPAVLHDHRSLVAAQRALDDRPGALAQRREDDRVFRTALREQRVPVLRTWLMWAWVAADREREFGGVRGRLFVTQAVLAPLALLVAIVLVWWSPAWLLAAVLPLLAALAWGRLAGLQLLLTISGAVLGPVVVAHLLPLALFRLIEAAVELLGGGDARSVLRPTVAGSGDGHGRKPGFDQGYP